MKEFMDKLFDQMEARSEPKEGEYLAEDGLLYCEKCHTPVQCRRMIFGKLRTLPCTCKCRQEEMQRQKEETEARERMMRIQRLKSTGIQERHLLDWRFDTAEDTETIRWAKNYVENWKQVRAENLGLLLWGDVGTGKSFAAACIANMQLKGKKQQEAERPDPDADYEDEDMSDYDMPETEEEAEASEEEEDYSDDSDEDEAE